jgi:uncharacterized membrane protein
VPLIFSQVRRCLLPALINLWIVLTVTFKGTFRYDGNILYVSALSNTVAFPAYWPLQVWLMWPRSWV